MFSHLLFRCSCCVFLLTPLLLSAQNGANVGVNTRTPEVTLDVLPSRATGNTNEGIRAPRLTKTRLAAISAPKEGTMVYVVPQTSSIFSTYSGSNVAVSDVTAVGYYYFNGTKWVQMCGLWMNDPAKNMVQLRNLSDNNTTRSITNQVFINDQGNMGLGYNDPRQKLIVEGNVWVGRPMKSTDWANNIPSYPQWGPYLAFEGTYSSAWSGMIVSNSDPMAFYRYDRALDESELRLVIGDNINSYDAFVIGPEHGGWVEGALGTLSSVNQFDEAFRFRANGEAFKKGGGTWQTVSDARTKEQVENYHRGLTDLLRIRPVSFRYKPFMGTGDKRYVGVIAQEVEQVAPSMVTVQKKKMGDLTNVKAVDPNEFTYMLINAVKELKAANDDLQQQINELKQQVKTLQK